MKKKKIECRKW